MKIPKARWDNMIGMINDNHQRIIANGLLIQLLENELEQKVDK